MGIIRVAGIGLLTLAAPLVWAARPSPPEQVDLTVGGTAAKMLADENALNRTFNLGPTGMRGWIYVEGHSTDRSRQILVTLVETNSPAHGVVEVGDVILGTDGKKFDRDARKSLGWAIDMAESEKEKGILPLIVWRDGKEEQRELKLKVMGSYSDTAPFDCAKSAKILDEGLQYLARREAWGRFSLEGLALLASGKPEYVELAVKKAVEIAASQGSAAFIEKINRSDHYEGRGWNAGYGQLFMMECYQATRDERLLPYVRAQAINTARGGSRYGTYGHAMADRNPNGELHGLMPPYGPVNQAGLACLLSMVMARKAGVQNTELDAGIARTSKFFGYYMNKGNIPYGEHAPLPRPFNDNNGSSGLAALAFSLQGDRSEMARFWGKMSASGYVSREDGHSGPFFGYLWGALGANVAGPRAAAAYFREVIWHYDLERCWDGSFAYTEGGGNHVRWSRDYRGVSATGMQLLTYALPLRKLCITGKDAEKAVWLSEAETAEAIESGRFDQATKSTEELLQSLRSWAPGQREAAARELGRRSDDVGPQLMKMAESEDANTREGVCRALGALGARAAPAAPVLIRLLDDDNRWIGALAAQAIKRIDERPRAAVPALLNALSVMDENDPLRVQQDWLAAALFYPAGHAIIRQGLLATSIEDVDKDELYTVARAMIERVAISRRGASRDSLAVLYDLLTLEDVKALAPDILAPFADMAPTNTMFSTLKGEGGVMQAGIRLLGKHRLEEGLTLAMNMYRWPMERGRDSQIRVAGEVIKGYGGAARKFLPELKELQVKEPARYPGIGDIIDAIENDKNPPQLISLSDAVKAGKKDE